MQVNRCPSTTAVAARASGCASRAPTHNRHLLTPPLTCAHLPLPSARAAHAAYTPLFNCPLTPTVKSVASGLAGGIACSSVDADALAAGTFAVQEIDAKSSNDDGPLQLVAVLNYGTQVVAGTNRFVTVVYNNTKGAMNIVQAQVRRFRMMLHAACCMVLIAWCMSNDAWCVLHGSLLQSA